MPKNPVTDPITDQEIAFAHLVLAGTMTDRRAAEAVGLKPDTAAYAKAKPRVQAYMRQHRDAMHQRRVQQETEELQRKNLCREQVLTRLFEIAALSHEVTRNSATAQIKALSMIIAMEGLIPDRRAAAKQEATESPYKIYQSKWLREQKAKERAEAGQDPYEEEDPDYQDEENPDISPAATPADAPEDSDPAPAPNPPEVLLNARPFSPAYNTHDPYASMDAEIPGTQDPYSNIRIPSNRRR